MSDAPARWGYDVVSEGWDGHPGRQYASRPASILQVLIEARRWRERPFILHGDRVVTFAEHEQLVHHIAGVIRRHGVLPGQRVGIFAANSPEWVATFFAVLEAGAVAVPFNRWWASEEAAYASELTDVSLVVTDAERQARLPSGIEHLLISELGAPTDDSSPWTEEDPWEGIDEATPAVILFTAGTTAFPKGAVLSHRALVANLQTLLGVARKLPQDVADDAPASVALIGLPLFHIGAIQLILVPLMTGSRIVFLEGRFSGDEALRLMSTHGVTMFSGVPTMMERMLRRAGPEFDLSTVRTIILGGAPVDDGLLERVRSVFPHASRGIGRTYGLTETGGVVSTGAGRAIESRPGSSGRLAPVVEVRVDAPDPDGNGELLVRSPACMSGYLGAADPGLDRDGWFRTGDLGRVDDEGFLFVTGRAKDVIIRGGENISVARVEAVLNEHPGVVEVCVLGLPDADLGEAVGAVVLREHDGVTGEELERFAQRELGRFEIPARWWFREGALPTNAAGKVLRAELRAQWTEATDGSQPGDGGAA